MTIEQNREEILRIAARHGARNVRVFGSVARGEDRFDSDVDLTGRNARRQITLGSRGP